MNRPITLTPNVTLRKSIEDWADKNARWMLVSLLIFCCWSVLKSSHVESVMVAVHEQLACNPCNAGMLIPCQPQQSWIATKLVHSHCAEASRG